MLGVDSDDLVEWDLAASQPRAEIGNAPLGVIDKQMNRVADQYCARDTRRRAVSSSRTRRASDDTIETTAPWSRDLRRAGVSQNSSRP